MLKSYFKIAWRNLWRHKTFSVINIIGLAIGISASLMMLLHVKQELNYETGYPKHKQIYRVASTDWAKMSPMVAEELSNDMPEIKKIGRLYYIKPQILSYNDVQISAQHNFAADPSVIDIFDLEFILGNPANALEAPNSIVLTRQVAVKLFGENTDPVGETIQLSGQSEHRVTGIIKDLPANSHFSVECLTAISGDRSITTNDSRIWRAVATYAVIASEQDAKRVNEKLKDWQLKFLEGIMTPEEVRAQGDFYELDPIDAIHLYSHKEKEMEANSDITYVYIFSALALLILLLACVNFINLFTAQTLKRVKEVGVRKVIGASKGQLVFQFLGEAFFIVTTAAIIAMTFAFIALPHYNNLAAIDLTSEQLFSFENALILIGIIVAAGLFSGSYPAFYVSKYRAIQNLKSKMSSEGDILGVRKGLVAFQFSISVLLLIATLAVFQQMKFINQQDLGFDKEAVVAIKLHGNLWGEAVMNKEVFRNKLLQNSNIKHMATTTTLMGERFGYEALKLRDRPDEQSIQSRFVRTDEGFIETMSIQLLEGRNFLPNADTSSSFIINEKAAELLQADNLIGQAAMNMANGYPGKVIGIVKNFNYASLHNEIEPLVIEYRKDWASHLLVNIGTKNVSETLSFLEATVQDVAPGTMFQAHFLDDNLRLLYQTESSFYRIFKIFSFLSIVIACFGLFALSAYTVETRTKEIGVHKVLGASLSQIVSILTLDFMKSVFLAGIVVIPIAYYGINRWLGDFAYKTDIQWWYFALPLIIVLAVALISISFQTIKAALSNPIDSLKYE